ncbi:MAG: SUMF1/EgtB/PvdO family nonheme iron enzyme [Myxococcales bacterium]|nr:SUMF1/EgtB/PvdO family nonheme iron enzyme [Myxococcales bacterium]
MINELGMRLIELPGPDGGLLWVAAHETTQAAFARFVDASGYTTTAEREGGAKVWRGGAWVWDAGASWRSVFPGPARPVVAVSWDDAVAFCAWLSEHEATLGALPPGHRYRLPTDAEWEHLARAGAHQIYAGTDDPIELCRYGNVPDLAAAREGLGRPVIGCDDGVGLGTAAVGRYAANAFGLHDMSGNVWEWTQSPDPRDPGARRMRGGSWSGRLDALRIDRADAYPPDLRGGAIGFRVVLAPAP